METETSLYELEKDGAIEFIQITDTHLLEAEEGHLLGLQTLFSLECVLNSVKTENGPFDFFVVSGDLSQDGSICSYQRLREELIHFDVPSFWFAGNHDNMENMRTVAKGTEHLNSVVRTKHWQLVLLNSQVEGSVFGNLADDQLEILETALKERPDLHTLISLHHHPINMESKWIDNIGVRNGDKLMAIAQAHDNVKCILWGHVHQDSDRDFNGIRMLSTPSTCVQFTPESEDFSVDKIAPGYRWMKLNPDGSIETKVSRVEGIEFEIDLSVKGY